MTAYEVSVLLLKNVPVHCRKVFACPTNLQGICLFYKEYTRREEERINFVPVNVTVVVGNSKVI